VYILKTVSGLRLALKIFCENQKPNTVSFLNEKLISSLGREFEKGTPARFLQKPARNQQAGGQAGGKGQR